MSSANKVRKGVVFSIMMAFITISVPMPAMAGMVDNTQLSAQSELQMQRDELRTVLSRENVRNTLLDYGVSDADVEQRINNMTPAELSQVHSKLVSLPAGGDAGSTVLTVLLILILLEVVGVIDIFPRV